MHSAAPSDARRRTLSLSTPSLAGRLRGIRLRNTLEQSIRTTLAARGFLELRPSLLTPAPGFEPHIRPFEVQSVGMSELSGYLPTSPEFLLKRILAQANHEGLEAFKKIFALTPAFRSEPVSPIHRPEFTLLEWYRVGKSADQEILDDTLALIQDCSNAATNAGFDAACDLTFPWERWNIPEQFEKRFGIDLGHPDSAVSRAALWTACKSRQFLPANHNDAPEQHTWDDLYFRLWLNVIEPSLPSDRPCIVEHYPPSQAALSELTTDARGRSWARRFEVYLNGIEIANAFYELRDPQTHRTRYEEEMRIRKATYGEGFPITPLDTDFIQSLESPGLPSCAGIALGVDRLIQILGGFKSIHETFAWDIHFSEEDNC